MSNHPVAILSTGLVTAVGLNAHASCAAIRARISNPTETRFMDSGGNWITAHQVPLEIPWRGRTKLAKMAALSIAESLADIDAQECEDIPLLLCVAEKERPGRLEGLDDQLFLDIQQELDMRFASGSGVVAHGRVSVILALSQARKLIHEQGFLRVLIVATDSLLTWPTLSAYDWSGRLLTARNSNGFMPGEAAGALLVGMPTGRPQLLCTGVGFAVERAHIECEEPLRADGLTTAIKAALEDAACEMHELDFRITDISGEHYYFKEAALALSRILRTSKEEFDIWHPAESIGEAGTAAGVTLLAVADVACRKGYAIGSKILVHMANDGGHRAAAVLKFVGA